MIFRQIIRAIALINFCVVNGAVALQASVSPDYAPVSAIILSADLFAAAYHAEDLVQAIALAGADAWILDAGGDGGKTARQWVNANTPAKNVRSRTRIVPMPHGSLWLRDYGPWPKLISRGGRAKPALEFIDLIHGDGDPNSESLPLRLGQLMNLPSRSLPLAIDGGNLIAVGARCVAATMGNRAEALQTEVTTKAPGVATMSEDATTLGCENLVLLERAAHVHVDMFSIAVDDRHFLVAEILPETLQVARGAGGQIHPDVLALRDSLDQSAAQLMKAGFAVARLPQPLPYRNSLRSYTNAILVNGHAIVPSYRRYGWGFDSYPDAALHPLYEKLTREAFARFGFATTFVNGDALSYNGGGLRCATTRIPRPL